MDIQISSVGLSQGQTVSTRHTCDGEDLSPPLKWSGVPAGAQSLAIICEDPDAPRGTFCHWLLYNLPASTRELAEGVANEAEFTNGARQGLNDFGRIGYNGPCPPRGDDAHRYYFRIYALNASLKFNELPRREDLLQAISGHILAEGQLMATYRRAHAKARKQGA